MRLAAVVPALALAPALAFVPPAGAATVAKGKSRFELRSDGGRYLAYQSDPAALEVYDARKRTTRHVALGGACVVHDMAAGRVLGECGAVVDAASGKVTRLRGRAEWLEIGARWAAGQTSVGNKLATRFTNLRTGKSYVTTRGELPFDLDGAKPRPLPPGLFYRANEGRFTFDARFTISPPIQSFFTLRRRDRAKPLLRVRQAGAYSSVEFGSGFATWTNGLRAYAYDVRHRKRIKWTFPDAIRHTPNEPVVAAHTRGRVFFGVPVEGGYELQVIRRPG